MLSLAPPEAFYYKLLSQRVTITVCCYRSVFTISLYLCADIVVCLLSQCVAMQRVTSAVCCHRGVIVIAVFCNHSVLQSQCAIAVVAIAVCCYHSVLLLQLLLSQCLL